MTTKIALSIVAIAFSLALYAMAVKDSVLLLVCGAALIPFLVAVYRWERRDRQAVKALIRAAGPADLVIVTPVVPRPATAQPEPFQNHRSALDLQLDAIVQKALRTPAANGHGADARNEIEVHVDRSETLLPPPPQAAISQPRPQLRIVHSDGRKVNLRRRKKG